MLSELKFVQGAVAKKDFVPALTHFVIKDGTVRGYNGTLALCTPINLSIECKPKAAELVSAIANCNDTVQMTLTAKGRLSIKSGAFKAFVNCDPAEETPHVEPEGERVELDGAALLAAFKAVWPFIGDDASRPWSNGVLLKDNSAFATNNVTLVEYWIGSAFPHVVNIPRAAVKEMIRINEAPLYAQMVDGSSVTFHYEGGRWVRTQLLELASWPLEMIIKVLGAPSTQAPIDPALFEGLKTIKPFIDKMNRVYFQKGCIATHAELDEASTYDLAFLDPSDGSQLQGIYAHEMLMLLQGVATSVDWSAYPRPCIFMGERLRGAIVGMRS